MTAHLSENQFARCLAGQATTAELGHTRECTECESELNRFAEAISMFQGDVRQRVLHRIARRPLVTISKPAAAHTVTRRWVLVAAAAAGLVILPLSEIGKKQSSVLQPISAESDADAVMNRVNLHLARTVPAPMEPLMLGLPDMNP